jgi:hypothetical protein
MLANSGVAEVVFARRRDRDYADVAKLLETLRGIEFRHYPLDELVIRNLTGD